MSCVQMAKMRASWPESHGALPDTRLYLLVDAAIYKNGLTSIRRWLPEGERRSLFDNTPEHGLDEVAPWLIHVPLPSWLAGNGKLDKLLVEERDKQSLSWIWSRLDIDDLREHLQPYLQGKLKNGRDTLVRFYDPQVMVRLFNIFTEKQKAALFAPIEEWWLWSHKDNARLVMRMQHAGV